jgi:hypothetical protein
VQPMDDDAQRASRDKLNRKLRQAFVESVEERSHKALGRGLTKEELERVLRPYPGDLQER